MSIDLAPTVPVSGTGLTTGGNASTPPAVFLPLMTEPMPDVSDRKRLEMQKIPFALPDRPLLKLAA